MQKAMKVFFLGTLLLVGRIGFLTRELRQSINVKIDDALTKVEMINDGEGPSTKEPNVEVEALDTEVEGSTQVEESTPMNPRMETS